MEKCEMLDLSGCKKNEEVVMAIQERVKSVPEKDLVAEVAKTFVFVEDSVKGIRNGLISDMNVYIYGESGYGKSDVTKHVLDILGVPYSVIVGYKDLPVESLLGIPDMHKFRNDGEYLLRFEKSVFAKNPGVIIGEEFGDIRTETAAALKDILTSRKYRNGGVEHESLISNMIITSNVSPKELGVDSSSKAFYSGRFPFAIHQTWPSYTKGKYVALLDAYFGTEIAPRTKYLLALLFSHNTTLYNIISPKKAIEVAKVFQYGGIDSIRSMGIDISLFEKFQRTADNVILNTEFNKLVVNVTEILDNSQEPYRQQFAGKCKYLLQGAKVPDMSASNFMVLEDKIDRILEDIKYENKEDKRTMEALHDIIY